MKNIQNKKTLTLKAAVLGLSLSAFAQNAALADGYPVKVVEVPVAVGQTEIYVLADSTGKTMYTFDPDPANGVPACNARCAEVWPPILLNDQEAATLTAPYSAVTRATGLKQLAINGKALYGYYLDRNPGDIIGDGVGGVWHIVPQEAPTEEEAVPPVVE